MLDVGNPLVLNLSATELGTSFAEYHAAFTGPKVDDI